MLKVYLNIDGEENEVKTLRIALFKRKNKMIIRASLRLFKEFLSKEFHKRVFKTFIDKMGGIEEYINSFDYSIREQVY